MDRLVAAYAVWSGAVIAWAAPAVPYWPGLLLLRVGLLVALVSVPARGARWEGRAAGRGLRAGPWRVLRFVRYAYPLPLALAFFEEVRFTVHALAPGTPYWFEPYLYAADRALFGELPAVLLAPWVSRPLTEVFEALYFSYYLILVGGLLLAWRGGATAPGRPPRAFTAAVTGMTAAFLLAFVHYPWLPARGPWEDPELVAALPPLQGFAFTPLVQWIIGVAAVPGGCFPSAHVAGAWGLVVGMGTTRPRTARWLGWLSVGMSLACVYTRYHHAVDVLAGLACGLVGGLLGRWLAASRRA